jgi:two-component system, NarL family, nitrate/nitrite response regulator NarL
MRRYMNGAQLTVPQPRRAPRGVPQPHGRNLLTDSNRLAPRPSIRVFVLADIRLYREGLSKALDQQAGLVVVGSAALDEHAVYHVTQCAAHVVLIERPSPNDKRILGRIGSLFPGTKVVAFGVSEDEKEVLHCIEDGVAGYVSRDATLQQLITTIQSVARGEFACSPRQSYLLLRRASVLAAECRGGVVGAVSAITLRERDVITLVDEGLSNKEIAVRLVIEISTVKNHIHHVLCKLNATRRGQAAARARANLTDLSYRSYHDSGLDPSI